MGIPQIIIIILYAINLGMSIENHGKEKTEKENVITTIIASVIMMALLWWGGFWD